MATRMPFLFGLTSDAFGYMLTKEDFGRFNRYDYVIHTSLGQNTAEIYMAEALKMIVDSPKADGHP